MSTATRIDDHSFWAGSKSKDSVFPKGAHTKNMAKDADHQGMRKYEDKEPDIKAVQKMNEGKLSRHSQPEGVSH
jgi:hypothetical protein